LHDQLEWLAREGFAHAYLPEQANRLRLRCERAGHAEQAPELVAWLQALVQTPLPLCEPGGELVAVSLADLPTAQAEMEFWLPTQALSTAVMDRLCRHHFLSGIDRPTLQTSVLHGMLMGFADLVFEHGGRYWVLDYKSNHLGADDSAYHPTALHAAMAQHRYDVQAAVYLLALHRLLQSRLGERYDPAQHLGGAVYWFVRGFNSPGHGVCLLQPSPGWLDPLDAMLAPLDAANPEPATSHQAGDAA
jgi:exodeoxyribonuclease V beta subunit